MSVEARRSLINWEDENLSLRQQCEIFGLNRSGLYYQPCPVSGEDLELMRLMDEEYTRRPFYGSRKLTVHLKGCGYEVGRHRVRRLMGIMGIEGIHPGPNLSKRNQAHAVYPYLLKGLPILRPNQVWGTDITYVPLLKGFCYLMAILDWFSRYVLAWRLSNSLETFFCMEALGEALLKHASPEIFNTDQGCQFTSAEWVGCLKENGVRISMDSKGRALDNIRNERFWRSLKYEDIYLNNYETMQEAHGGIRDYIRFYNEERFHQALNYKTPHELYFGEVLEKTLELPMAQGKIVA